MGDVVDELESVWRLVEQRARATPEATMLVAGRDRHLTFAEFRLAAEQAAAGLIDGGVTAGTTVSWQLPSGIEAAVLMAALARLSVAQNPLLPSLRHREVSFILAQTGARTLIVPRVVHGFDHSVLASEMAAEHPIRPLVLDGAPRGPFGLGLPSAEPTLLGAVEVAEPAAARWLYYTSGTTADPKGVRHTDRSIIASANAMAMVGRLCADDAVCAPIPFSHIGGMMIIAVSLRTGCRIVLFESFDPELTPGLAAEHGTTVLGAVPMMLPAFFAAQRERGASPLLPRLRFVFSGGAPVPTSLHAQVKRELGGLGVVSTWGLTEAPQVTFPPLDATDAQFSGTTGRPVPGVDVRVTDDQGRPCAVGVDGELRVRGPQMCLGYVDRALDDAIDADGFLRTGDLGSVDRDGFVRVTGRIKDVIIRNGENISALEVEQVLRTHSSVADATVLGIPDDRTGERCCAVIALVAGARGVTLADLRECFEAAGVARHKFPEALVIVESIPRNDLGKARTQLVRSLVEHDAGAIRRDDPLPGGRRSPGAVTGR
jgi:cyclohexanecarboxylate-CoA ligase